MFFIANKSRQFDVEKEASIIICTWLCDFFEWYWSKPFFVHSLSLSLSLYVTIIIIAYDIQRFNYNRKTIETCMHIVCEICIDPVRKRSLYTSYIVDTQPSHFVYMQISCYYYYMGTVNALFWCDVCFLFIVYGYQPDTRHI